MDERIDINNLVKTLLFMKKAHGGQMMKDKKLPYIEHPMAVLAICLEYCEGEIDFDFVVSLCLLHDVVEDTPITYEDIASEFGPKVADGVAALTKNKAMKNADAMKDSINRIIEQPREVALVKLADRVHNLRNIPMVWDDARIKEYRAESQYIFDKLCYADANLANLLKERIANYTEKHIDYSIK